MTWKLRILNPFPMMVKWEVLHTSIRVLFWIAFPYRSLVPISDIENTNTTSTQRLYFFLQFDLIRTGDCWSMGGGVVRQLSCLYSVLKLTQRWPSYRDHFCLDPNGGWGTFLQQSRYQPQEGKHTHRHHGGRRGAGAGGSGSGGCNSLGCFPTRRVCVVFYTLNCHICHHIWVHQDNGIEDDNKQTHNTETGWTMHLQRQSHSKPPL